MFGNSQDPQTTISPSITPTSKSIVNQGTLYINSITPNTVTMRLSKNALIGQTQIVLTGNPDWQVGDQIAIASTS